MPASSNNKQAASSDAVAITSIPAADIAEALAASEPSREELAGGTVRETNTAYEDRTDNPTEDRDVDYEFTEQKLDSGSILTTYNAPVGGFPEVA